MSSRGPTIIEVAATAGVAVSTVSRVLNGGSASLKSQQKVERAVAALGFAPSHAARNLKLRKTGIVGIAGASTRAPWFTALLDGMQSVLTKASSSIAICSLERDGEFEPGPVQMWIGERRIDSLVLVRPGPRERLLSAAAWEAGIPVVSAVPDDDPERGLVIRGENEKGGQLAGEHLLELGHRRISFLGGPPESVDSQHRLLGLRAELARHGIELGAERVGHGRSYDVSAGQELARAWLLRRAGTPMEERDTAVVLGNDGLALGFLRTAQSYGLRIPDELSVMGFDGIPEGAFVYPALTSVAQPVERMGADIATHLLEAGTNSPVDLITRRYGVELVVRESTAPPLR